MKRAFGLRAALILLVLIAIVPVFAVVLQASLSEQRGRLERTGANLRALIDLTAAHQEGLVEGARQILTAIAHSPPVYEGDDEACRKFFQVLRGKYPRYANLGLLDPRGNLVCRSDGGTAQINSADRLFFRQAVRTSAFAVGDYVLGRASGRPSLSFGMPVYREDASLRGVLFVGLDLQRAEEQLRRVAVPEEVTLVVTDAEAVVLASAGAAPLPVGTRVGDDFLRGSILAGTAREESGPGPDGDETLYAVRPVGLGQEGRIFVGAFASQDRVLAPTMRRLHLQIAALGVITLLAAAAAWLFGDRVLARPIARLLRRAEALRREELPLDAPPQAGSLYELAQLERGLDEMARSLSERAVLRDGALAEMQAQKQLMESVLDGMSEGVLVVDTRGHVLLQNDSARRIMPGAQELSREKAPLEVSPRDWGFYQLDGRTALTPAQRPVARALSGELVESYRYIARGRLSGGPEKVIQTTVRPLAGPGRGPAGAVKVFSDVTQAWRAEQALQESEQRYRTLFESNPHPMWVFDTQTLEFITVNDAAVAHYGYSREEFLVMTIRDIRPFEDVARLESAVSDTGSAMTAPVVWQHRVRDGRLIWVEISSHPLVFAGRPARMVLAHDITQRLQAQQALAQLNETLERRVVERTRELAMANTELESFSYSVSHDLRAPLQVIDGFGRALLAKHSSQLPAQGAHYLQRIRENTQQMSQLIDDLLSLAKVTRTTLVAETCDLAPRVRRVFEQLRARFPDREVDTCVDEHIRAVGDPGLLGVVLENLIENAWKFTARTAGAQIRVGCRPGDDGRPVYYVADNGAGFEMAYADKLFKAFQRLHAATEFEGTGIGLATVHRVITRHGGRVWAESAPGQGASFLFTLKEVPQDEEQPNPAGGGQPRPPGADPDDPGGEQRPQ